MSDYGNSQISPNIIYLHSNLFPTMRKLMSYIDFLNKNCFGTNIGLCNGDNNNNGDNNGDKCDTTLVLYIDNPFNHVITPEDIEGGLYRNVLAYLSIDNYQNFGEIYNVCTSKAARGKGIMKRLFQVMLEEVPHDRLWLGVDLRNPMIDIVTHLYVSVGFKPEGIQEITPTDYVPGFPFISFIYNKGDEPHNIIKVEAGVRDMVDQYKRNDGYCSIDLRLPSNIINDIYQLIKNRTEYAGIMISKRRNGYYDLSLGAVTKGTFRQVNIPLYYISWHTHPFVCYVADLCYIGWPSGTDMRYVLSKYKEGMLAHFVFTHEGIYLMQLSIPMMRLIRKLPQDIIDAMSVMVEFYYTHMEQFRSAQYDEERAECLQKSDDISCLTYHSDQRNLSINTMMNIMNNYLLFDMVNQAPIEIENYANIVGLYMTDNQLDPNIPLFNAKFYSYDNNDLLTTINYIMAPKESTCPIPSE